MTRGRVTDEEYGQLRRRLDEVARRVDEGTIPLDDTMRVLQGIIEGRVKFAGGVKRACQFKPWRTIKLGTDHQTADDFRKALKKAGCKIGDWANDIIDKPAFTAATEEVEVDLVNVSVAELGFPNGATRKEIYQKAQELGLELCPPEVGPQLCLQYKDQPNGEWLLIGMEPIAGSGGRLEVFHVARVDYDRWLSGDCGSPDYFWYDDRRWVFIRRK